MNNSILHTADWHLRDSQYTSMERGVDFTKAALSVIDIAMACGVKAICNCGDILNNKRPSSKNIRDLVEIDRRLQSANIPMYVISGNHVFARPSWISIVRQENQSKSIGGIIDADNALNIIPNTGGMTVYGIPSMGAGAFRAKKGDWPEADILMSHEMVKEFCAFQTEGDTLTLGDYPFKKYKVILLGDIHTSQYRKLDNGRVLVGYPGPIEFCSRHEGREKVVTVMDWENREFDTDQTLRLIKLPTRPVIVRQILTELDLNKVTKEIKENKHKNPMIFIRYDGKMPDVPAILMTMVVGTKCILRCAAYNDLDVRKILTPDEEVVRRLKTPQDFVSKFINPNAEIYPLACMLADPDVDHRRLISDFVNEKIEHETDTFENKGFQPSQANR